MLSDTARDEIRRVLKPFADRIASVAVFGSRANGRARHNSDIDLVIHGDITQDRVDRLWTLFEESDLPVTVDVLAYSPNLYPPLKQHIDSCSVTLFTHDELLVA